jgi:hypothetical protein
MITEVLGLRCEHDDRVGLVHNFPLTALGWILAGCVRSVEPELRAPGSGPPVSHASGHVVVCYLLAALIVNRLQRAHRLVVGALRPPFQGQVSH